MHTKREGKALLRPRFGAQFAQALIEINLTKQKPVDE